MSLLAPTLQLFFGERMAKQRQASPATITSYRNTFRLLLGFVQNRTGKAPSTLDWNDLDVEAISAFLDHLETDRHNSARSRNARLAAVRSLFRYAALRHPEHAQLIGQVLAIPQKRYDRTIVCVPRSQRDRRPARRPRPEPMGRPARPRPVGPGRANRSSTLRAHRNQLRRHRTRRRGARPLQRERTQATLRPALFDHNGVCCGSGSRNDAGSAMIRCSRPGPADASATTPWKRASASTSQWPASDAPP